MKLPRKLKKKRLSTKSRRRMDQKSFMYDILISVSRDMGIPINILTRDY